MLKLSTVNYPKFLEQTKRQITIKSRRSIDGKKRNPEKALSFIDDALVAIKDETEWRKNMLTGPYNKLVAFESYTKNNLGLREQERLTEEQVDMIVPCLARHRNISLHF